MNKIFPSGVLAVVAFVSASAATPEAIGVAPRQAVDKLSSEALTEVRMPSSTRLRAWNRDGGGFAVTLGDRVVGYSDTGSIDPDNLPPALADLLRNSQSSTPAARREAQQGAFTPCAPLLGNIAWDQNDPFNLLIPNYMGSNRSAVGCTATAMAQIFRFYKYPAQGEGSNSYIPEFYPKMGTLSADFSQSHYDWENMKPRYYGGESQEERMAAALLCRDLGYSVNMAYGPQSGADNASWPASITSHFGYDEGVAIRYRIYHDIDSWNAIIRAEVDAGRPVYASGFTSAGGHAFVFDGYDADGLIHVNWGWSGMSNGYFDPMWLSPATQGTGGSVGGFNSRQLIITNIRPARAGSLPTPTLYSEEALSASPRKGTAATEFRMRLNGKIVNVGWTGITVCFGVRLTDAEGTTIAEYPAEGSYDLGNGGSAVNVAMPLITLPGDLADGTYYLYPVASAEGGTEWERVRDADLSFPNYLIATVSGGNVSFSEPVQAKLTATEPMVDGKFYRAFKGRVTATLSNTGDIEYSGSVAVAAFDADGKRLDSGDVLNIDIMPGKSQQVELFATFNNIEGACRLAVVNELGKVISGYTDVDVQAMPVYGIAADKAPDFGDNLNVSPSSFTATASVKAVEGAVYSGQIFLYFYDLNGNVAGCAGPIFTQLSDGAPSAHLTFTGSLPNALPGAEYDAFLVDGEGMTYINPRSAATTRIRFAPSAGITDVTAPAEDASTAYYSLMGVRLAQPPVSGLYIEVTGGKVFKRVARGE